MRWCAEDLGVTLRWRGKVVVVMPFGTLAFPSAAVPGKHACGMKAIEVVFT